MPASLKCRSKLPVEWIWVTKRLSDTLGSVEFLEVVGGDLEVPPAWKFEAEVRGPKIVAPDGERWLKLSTKDEVFAQDIQKSLRSSPDHDGNNSHIKGKYEG